MNMTIIIKAFNLVKENNAQKLTRKMRNKTLILSNQNDKKWRQRIKQYFFCNKNDKTASNPRADAGFFTIKYQYHFFACFEWFFKMIKSFNLLHSLNTSNKMMTRFDWILHLHLQTPLEVMIPLLCLRQYEITIQLSLAILEEFWILPSNLIITIFTNTAQFLDEIMLFKTELDQAIAFPANNGCNLIWSTFHYNSGGIFPGKFSPNHQWWNTMNQP